MPYQGLVQLEYPLVSSQYFDLVRLAGKESAQDRSCRALWAAVLHEAYDNLSFSIAGESETIPMERIRAEAIRWFLSKKVYVGSFLWICKALDLAPEVIRDLLQGRGLLDPAGKKMRRIRYRCRRGAA